MAYYPWMFGKIESTQQKITSDFHYACLNLHWQARVFYMFLRKNEPKY